MSRGKKILIMNYEKNWKEFKNCLIKTKDINKESICKKPTRFADPYNIIDITLDRLITKMNEMESGNK